MTTNETAAQSAEWDPLAEYPLTFCRTADEAKLALADLATATHVAADTETVIERDENGDIIKKNLDVDGPGPWRVLSIAARWADGTKASFVLDMGYIDGSEIAHLFDGVRPFGWNANFDRFTVTRGGIPIVHWWDAMLGEALLRCGAGGGDGRMYTSLAKALRKFMGYDVDGKKSTRLDYQTVEVRPELTEDEKAYAAIDAIGTLEVALRIGGLLRAAGLVNTFVTECNAQPFIQGMVRGGIPLDVAGYTKVIEAAAAKAADAAERIAVATTGRELLGTLVAWRQTRTGTTIDGDVVEQGLELLHDPAIFAEFIGDVMAQAEAATDAIAQALGINRTNDLFNEDEDATFVPLPFTPGDDTNVRAWLSKTAPHYAAAYVVASRGEGDFPTLLNATFEEAKEAGGRRRKFTKDHDIEQILAHVASLGAGNADLTEAFVTACGHLANLRRYGRIISVYGPKAGAGEVVKLVPTWKISSDVQVKEMLNTYATAEVEAYTTAYHGEARPLGKADSVDADALKLIGADLCKALLDYRAADKIVTTYGDNLLGFVNSGTGRVHAKYTQALVGTGRLASSQPNAQNLSPLAKPHMKPVRGKRGLRVLVAADLSQAELRFVASEAGDENMLEAFRSGVDLHARTASLMFSIDLPLLVEESRPLAELVGQVAGVESYAAENPDMVGKALYKDLRQRAKAVAFGYNYGLKEGSLSNQLTVQGVPTTREEAKELLAKFDQAYPQLAAWMQARADFIANLSGRARAGKVGLDVASTWMLHMTFAKATSAYNALARELERTPTWEEVSAKITPDPAAAVAARTGVAVEEVSEADAAAEAQRVANLAAWACGHDHSVALTKDGSPFQFESRTKMGRRRLFQVPTKQLTMAIINQSLSSRTREVAEAAHNAVAAWNNHQVQLHEAKVAAGKGGRGEAKVITVPKPQNGRINRDALEKAFEDPEARTAVVGAMMGMLPAAQVERMWNAALADRIRAMGNQYRNHPIQGGVADAVLDAFARIYADLGQFRDAVPVQSVHDSIVIECDLADAAAVRDMVVAHMQAALALQCPSVPCVADGDIQLSLDGKTALSEEELAELYTQEQVALAA